jgi:hypothetical protein
MRKHRSLTSVKPNFSHLPKEIKRGFNEENHKNITQIIVSSLAIL